MKQQNASKAEFPTPRTSMVHPSLKSLLGSDLSAFYATFGKQNWEERRQPYTLANLSNQ